MGFAYKFLLLLNSTLASSTTNYVPFFENKRSSEKWQGSKKRGAGWSQKPTMIILFSYRKFAKF